MIYERHLIPINTNNPPHYKCLKTGHLDEKQCHAFLADMTMTIYSASSKIKFEVHQNTKITSLKAVGAVKYISILQ